MGPLGPLLDGVDGPDEFLPLGTFEVGQHPVPFGRCDALEQAEENLLSAIAPTVGGKAWAFRQQA